AGRIGKEIAELRLAMPRQVLALYSAGQQQLVDEGVHAEAVVRRPPPPPRLAGHGSVDVEDAQRSIVIASRAKQSRRPPRHGLLRRGAPRNDELHFGVLQAAVFCGYSS